MSGGEQGTGAIGESPAFHSIIGGIPMKKKVYPNKSPKKLSMKPGWKSSFKKFSTKGRKGK